MKLRQLHYIHEVAKHNLNVTAASEALYTSQPGVSKQIRLLEDELGVQIFERNGKHLVRITEVGKAILELAEKVLLFSNNIERTVADFRNDSRGPFSIATTHTQARYALPPIIRRFKERYPDVVLHLHQGTPEQIAEMASLGQVDCAIATEAIELFDDLVMLPCYRWNRCALVPKNHPLTRITHLSIEALAEYPIITYVFGFTGRSQLDKAFASHGLEPNLVLTAVDSDVIKTYVRLGLGVGIIAKMAYEPETDADLVVLPSEHLFEPSVTRIGFRQGLFLRSYMLDFIQMFAPHLTPEIVKNVGALRLPEERQLLIDQLDLYVQDYAPELKKVKAVS